MNALPLSKRTLNNDCLSETEILRWTKTRELGRQIEIHNQIDSTNNRAKELAKSGVPHGYLVCAEYQTGGKGRFGRSFFSPQDTGIYITYVIRPHSPAEQTVSITSMTAVAVSRAIENLCDISIGIKWVNDLYVNGRKLCGILCESVINAENGSLDYVVVGIGINVGQIVFPEELKNIATSIGNECDIVPSRNRLIAEISTQLENLYYQWETSDFLEEYRARSILIGKEVTVICGDKSFNAHVMDIDDQCRLIVNADKGIMKLYSGEVTLKMGLEK